MLLVLFLASAAVGDDWRIVEPSPGAPMEHAPLRVMSMITSTPTDLKVRVKFRGAVQRFGELRLGPPSSMRMAVAIDEVSPTEADLYVDVNRDRILEAGEKATKTAGLWRVPVSVIGAPASLRKRTLVFRRRSSGGVSYAVAGYAEGVVMLKGTAVRVRRVDGDGNGSFSDPQDQLWIDLDRNGVFDPLAEQFAFGPMLTIGGVRLATSGEPFAGRLEFRPITDEGGLELAGRWRRTTDELVRCSLSMSTDDGLAVVVEPDRVEKVPVGEYRADTLHLQLNQANSGSWHYVFSSPGREGPKHRVEARTTSVVDPVGKLEFGVELDQDPGKSVRPGSQVALRYRLRTGEGLCINDIGRGDSLSPYSESSPKVVARLKSSSGETVAVSTSGFL